MKLSNRIARLENTGPSVAEIVIEGGIPGGGADDQAQTLPDCMTWQRAAGEGVAAFKARVRGAADAAARFIIWGGLPI